VAIRDECLEDLGFWVVTNRKVALRALDLMEAVLTVDSGARGSGRTTRRRAAPSSDRQPPAVSQDGCPASASTPDELATFLVAEM
jgi:hypothetical protein